jgi:hypothetical protein
MEWNGSFELDWMNMYPDEECKIAIVNSLRMAVPGQGLTSPRGDGHVGSQAHKHKDAGLDNGRPTVRGIPWSGQRTIREEGKMQSARTSPTGDYPQDKDSAACLSVPSIVPYLQ